MKLFTLLLLVCLSINVYAQPKNRTNRGIISPKEVIYFDTITIPQDSSFKVYFTYKIGYDNLYFVKSNSAFKSGLALSLEITGESKVVFRGGDKKEIIVDDYNKTISRNNYINGFIEFILPEGNYELKPIIKLENTNQEFILRNTKLNLSSKDSIIKPIVIESTEVICEADTLLKILNFRNSIPFGDGVNKILFAVPINYNEVSIEFIQKKKSIENNFYKSILSGNLSIESCDNDLFVKIDESELEYNFIFVDGITNKLDEGKTEIILTCGNEKQKFNLEVLWIDKPRSLMNSEIAVEALKLIADNESVSTISSMEDDKQYEGIKNYFYKFDPDKSTTFNPILAEFYERVDYASKEFSTIDEPNGMKSDFGKIFILYGYPDNKQRTFSESNEIIEIWIYEKIDTKFYFKDKTGLGNFKLIKQ